MSCMLYLSLGIHAHTTNTPQTPNTSQILHGLLVTTDTPPHTINTQQTHHKQHTFECRFAKQHTIIRHHPHRNTIHAAKSSHQGGAVPSLEFGKAAAIQHPCEDCSYVKGLAGVTGDHPCVVCGGGWLGGMWGVTGDHPCLVCVGCLGCMWGVGGYTWWMNNTGQHPQYMNNHTNIHSYTGTHKQRNKHKETNTHKASLVTTQLFCRKQGWVPCGSGSSNCMWLLQGEAGYKISGNGKCMVLILSKMIRHTCVRRVCRVLAGDREL